MLDFPNLAAGAVLGWLACVVIPDVAVIPGGALKRHGPKLAKKLWDKVRRRSPKE